MSSKLSPALGGRPPRAPASQALVCRGLAGVVFGCLAFVWPGMGMRLLAGTFAIYALADGALALVIALRWREAGDRHSAPLAEATLSIVAGTIAILSPSFLSLGLVLLVAARSVLSGLLEVAHVVGLAARHPGHWLTLLSGVVSVGFGALLALRPLPGLAAVWLIGANAMIVGAILLAWGFVLKLHELHESIEHPAF